METWSSQFENEIAAAFRARKNGNEGKARVCARRAAGLIAAEYLDRKGVQHSHQNAITNLRILGNTNDVSANIKATISRLLMRVDTHYELPIDTDLIQDALLLRDELLRNGD